MRVFMGKREGGKIDPETSLSGEGNGVSGGLEGGAFVGRVGLRRGKGKKAEWAHVGCDGSRKPSSACVTCVSETGSRVLRRVGR